MPLKNSIVFKENVMAGLVPPIYAFVAKTWILGTRPGMTSK